MGKMITAVIPEIEISEERGKCKGDQLVSTDMSGFDGKNKSRVRIVMCGKGMVRAARLQAIEGLKEALNDIESEDDIPEVTRKDVLKSLNEQIQRLEKQVTEEPSDGDDT
jgi:bla regulator protein blaR1